MAIDVNISRINNFEYSFKLSSKNRIRHVAMASAEFKDREHGDAFDWCDILAGMTLPVLVWVCSLIVLIIK